MFINVTFLLLATSFITYKNVNLIFSYKYCYPVIKILTLLGEKKNITAFIKLMTYLLNFYRTNIDIQFNKLKKQDKNSY